MDAPVSLTQVNPAAMDTPVSATLSTLQLWMLQCQWHCQPCIYWCSSVNDTVNPAAMDAPVSVTLSTLQLWMLRCQWHCQPCSYGCSSASYTANPVAMDAPLSVTLPTLQVWILQCQWHWQPCSYGRSSVSDTGASIAAVLTRLSIIHSSLAAQLCWSHNLLDYHAGLWRPHNGHVCLGLENAWQVILSVRLPNHICAHCHGNYSIRSYSMTMVPVTKIGIILFM